MEDQRTITFNFANNLLAAGRLDDARKAFLNYLDGIVPGREDAFDAHAMQAVGLCFKKQGYLDDAIDYYSRALALARKLKLHALEVDSVSNLGVVYKNQGLGLRRAGKTSEAEFKFALAETQYLEARKLDYVLGNHAGVAADLLNLGIIYRHRAERAKAIGAFQECAKLARNLNDPALLGKSSGGLGTVYLDLQQWDNAISAFEKSVEAAMLLSGHDAVWTLATARGNLGIALWHKGDKAAAKAHLQHSDAIFRHMQIDDEIVQHIRSLLSSDGRS